MKDRTKVKKLVSDVIILYLLSHKIHGYYHMKVFCGIVFFLVVIL